MSAPIQKAQPNLQNESQLMTVKPDNGSASNQTGLAFSQVYEQQKPSRMSKEGAVANQNGKTEQKNTDQTSYKAEVDTKRVASDKDKSDEAAIVDVFETDSPQVESAGFSYSGTVNFLDTYLQNTQPLTGNGGLPLTNNGSLPSVDLSSLSESISLISGESVLPDVGVQLPQAIGETLPLSQEQLEFIGSMVKGLKPEQSLSLKVTESGLQVSVLSNDKQILEQSTLALKADVQKSLAGSGLFGDLNFEVVLLKKSNGDLMNMKSADVSIQSFSALLQKAPDSVVAKELFQALTPSSTSASAPGLPALNDAGLSYRVADGQLSASSQVNVPVGKPGWGEHINQQVAWFSSKNIAMAEIKLDPPDLGPLHIKIANNGEQTNITFTSPHAQVRDALDQTLPRLREMLLQQGIDVAGVDVGGETFKEKDHQAESRTDSEKHQSGAGTEDEILADENIAADSVGDVVWHNKGLINEVV